MLYKNTCPKKHYHFGFILALFLFVNAAFADNPIKHKMLLLDESRHRMLYVDESDASKNWTYQPTDKNVWDVQLIGDNKVLASATGDGGFREIDLATRKVVREVLNKKYAPTRGAIRLPDGRTVVAADKKTTEIYILDKDGNEVKAINRPDTHSIRLIRRTPNNTLLFGGQNEVYEITLDGEQVNKVTVPNSRHNYQALELPNGNWLIANGYGCQLVEMTKDGKVVKTYGGNPAPEGLFYLFYSKFQILKNGNIVVATWTGHGAEDSNKGQQIVEFNPDGKVVWTWHDTKLAGSINGVIVLDDLDTGKFSEQ